MSLETIKVKAPSKFGFMAEDGSYINISKKAGEAGLKPEAFEAGRTYVMDIWTAGSGKKYVQAAPKPTASSQTPAASVPSASQKAPEAKPKSAASGSKRAMVYGREASEYELVKDVRINVSGLEQAIISAPFFTMVNGVADVETFEKTLEEFTRAALRVNQKLVDERK